MTMKKTKYKTCDDCGDRVKPENICTVKSRTTAFQLSVCEKCAFDICSTQGKHFYCVEQEPLKEESECYV